MPPAARVSSEWPAVGDLVAGKYLVEAELGAGGMGVVLAARHLELDQHVALKFMTGSGDALAVRRFLREARAAARVRSEHVARVTDFGRLPDGACYIVMEYLAGVTMSRLIDDRGRLPAAEAVDLVLQACDALAEAHAHGIVHRDVKPSNLFLARRADGSAIVKVLDFGVAKAHGPAEDAASLTSTNDVVGSAFYMAPEQLLGSKGVTPACDLWALGVVLYELLSGARPFDGETVPAVHLAISTRRPTSLHERCPDVPAGLAAVVHDCLQKRVSARPASIAALARALLPFTTSAYSALLVERIGRLREVRGDEPITASTGSTAERAPTATSDAEGTPEDGADDTATSPPSSSSSSGADRTVDPYGHTVGASDRPGPAATRREAPLADRTITAMHSSIAAAPAPPARRWPYAVGLGAVGVAAVVVFVGRVGAVSPPPPVVAAPVVTAAVPVAAAIALDREPTTAATTTSSPVASASAAAPVARPRAPSGPAQAPARATPPASSAGGLFLPSGRK